MEYLHNITKWWEADSVHFSQLKDVDFLNYFFIFMFNVSKALSCS